MKSFNWPVHVKTALDATQFMALATAGAKGPWSNPVYFVYDNALNFYFISQPESRHMQNLKTNPEVAIAIFSTGQSPIGDVIGLQASGQATLLPDEQVAAAHRIYYDRSPEIPGIPSELAAYLGSAAHWKFVKITPTEVGYFDSANFGNERQVVPHGVVL